jgi:hypothetical protein
MGAEIVVGVAIGFFADGSEAMIVMGPYAARGSKKAVLSRGFLACVTCAATGEPARQPL